MLIVYLVPEILSPYHKHVAAFSWAWYPRTYLIDSASGMAGLAQTGLRCREPSTPRQCMRHRRRRRASTRPILLLVVVFAFIRGVPRSRGWLLPVPQRGTGSPVRLKRLRAPSRMGGPPFRRRARITGQGVACRGLTLSAALAVPANLSVRVARVESTS